jgi:hypothetical protein
VPGPFAVDGHQGAPDDKQAMGMFAPGRPPKQHIPRIVVTFVRLWLKEPTFGC